MPSVENDSLCNVSLLNTKADWPSHFRLLWPKWNTILRAILWIWGYFEVSIFILEDTHCSAAEFACPWCVWTHLWSPGQPCQGEFPPNALLLLHSTRLTVALRSPWPFCSWGRFVAKTSALLSAELKEIASNSLSSHFPWDKLLHVVCLYIWLHCSRCNGCRLCQWSGFLSFTLLSVMKFASNLQAL